MRSLFFFSSSVYGCDYFDFCQHEHRFLVSLCRRRRLRVRQGQRSRGVTSTEPLPTFTMPLTAIPGHASGGSNSVAFAPPPPQPMMTYSPTASVSARCCRRKERALMTIRVKMRAKMLSCWIVREGTSPCVVTRCFIFSVCR